MEAAEDPSTAVPGWLRECVPLGIVHDIPGCDIFSAVDMKDGHAERDMLAEASSRLRGNEEEHSSEPEGGGWGGEGSPGLS